MPPKRPRQPEGGPDRSNVDATLDVHGMAERHGMTEAEAAEVVTLPFVWMSRMTKSDASMDDILAEVRTAIADYENRFGPHRDWDKLRIIMGHALLAFNDFENATELLSSVDDIDYMAEAFVSFTLEGVRSGSFTLEEIISVNVYLQAAFTRRGRELEFLRVGRNSLIAHAPAMLTLADAGTEDSIDELAGEHLDPVTDWAEIEQRRHGRASWDDIVAIVNGEADWPDATHLAIRRSVAGQFAQHQHTMLSKPKIERKDVEALKAYLKDGAANQPAAVWDRFRFVAAVSLYDANAPNFGRGMARAMSDPTMTAMVCHALLETGRGREALELAHEIPDHKVFGKLLYTGQWPDRAAIDLLLEDITYATQRNARKYDPAMRVAVAEGLHEMFVYSYQIAAEAEDAESMVRWLAEAEDMDKRLRLLRHQAEIKFITAPKKR